MARRPALPRVVRVAHLLQPIDGRAVLLLLDGDVAHACDGGGPCQCFSPGAIQTTSPGRISSFVKLAVGGDPLATQRAVEDSAGGYAGAQTYGRAEAWPAGIAQPIASRGADRGLSGWRMDNPRNGNPFASQENSRIFASRSHNVTRPWLGAQSPRPTRSTRARACRIAPSRSSSDAGADDTAIWSRAPDPRSVRP